MSLLRSFSAGSGPERRRGRRSALPRLLAADPHPLPHTQRITHLLPQTSAAAKRVFPAPRRTALWLLYKRLGISGDRIQCQVMELQSRNRIFFPADAHATYCTAQMALLQQRGRMIYFLGKSWYKPNEKIYVGFDIVSQTIVSSSITLLTTT